MSSYMYTRACLWPYSFFQADVFWRVCVAGSYLGLHLQETSYNQGFYLQTSVRISHPPDHSFFNVKGRASAPPIIRSNQAERTLLSDSGAQILST